MNGGWVACIHARTVSMRAAALGARPECDDCAELGALKRLEVVAKAVYEDSRLPSTETMVDLETALVAIALLRWRHGDPLPVLAANANT